MWWMRLRSHRRAILCVLVSQVTAAIAPSTTSSVNLEAALAQSASQFTRVSGVYELRDGRLLVVDAGDNAIIVLDRALQRSTTLGRIGSGPLEYRTPRALLPIGGDSLLVSDPANMRSLVINASGAIVGTVAMSRFGGGPGPLRGMLTFEPVAADTLGGLYERGAAVQVRADGTTQLADSAPIVRLLLSAKRKDTVASIREMSGTSRRLVPGTVSVLASPGPRRPLASADEWAVAADGRVAVASLQPYRVTYFHEGRRIDGSLLPADSVAVTPEDVKNWSESRADARGVVMDPGTGRMANRRGSVSPNAAAEWPTHFPAFLPKALRFDLGGRLWIRRAGPRTAETYYDVVDAKGGRELRVSVGVGSEIIGFGRRHLYRLTTDEDGLQSIQRYYMPSVLK